MAQFLLLFFFAFAAKVVVSIAVHLPMRFSHRFWDRGISR